jgi:hypothetical protein
VNWERVYKRLTPGCIADRPHQVARMTPIATVQEMIAAAPEIGEEERHPAVEAVQVFLRRFGYLGDAEPTGHLDRTPRQRSASINAWRISRGLAFWTRGRETRWRVRDAPIGTTPVRLTSAHAVPGIGFN